MDRNKCPAYVKTCTSCKRLNHFTTVCKAKKTINAINDELTYNEQDIDEELYIE